MMSRQQTPSVPTIQQQNTPVSKFILQVNICVQIVCWTFEHKILTLRALGFNDDLIMFVFFKAFFAESHHLKNMTVQRF